MSGVRQAAVSACDSARYCLAVVALLRAGAWKLPGSTLVYTRNHATATCNIRDAHARAARRLHPCCCIRCCQPAVA